VATYGGRFLASHEDIKLLQISDETDDVIFLLSTDWFSTWMFSLGQWRGGQASLALTKDVARRAASDILSGSTDYYLVDLSPTRKAATFDQFMKELKACLDEKASRDLCRLVDSITGHSLLSRDQRWALKAALIRAMALGLGADARAALGEGVVAVVVNMLELLGAGEIPFQPESRWDVELDSKFGGLPGRLEDLASAAYAPSVLLQEVAVATRRLQYGQPDVARLADWWAGAAQHLCMYVEPRSLAIHLDELGGLAGES